MVAPTAAKTALVAIGGNSLIRAGERGTIDEQLANAHGTARSIVSMLQRGWRVVITHGNGPQVGAALIRSERASTEVYTHPLDVCVATTQSEIGYLLQRALEHELRVAGLEIAVATVLTQVKVDPDDRAFAHPTKPIGPFYTREDAEERHRRLGWSIVEDAARGWRRVVASPEPVAVLEESVIAQLVDLGIVVIALGGGGIPIVEAADGSIVGSEAVIDKDRASALLASRLGVDLFIISTDTDRVYLDYRTPAQTGIERATTDAMMEHHADGHFPPGSMGPKVESAVRFLRAGGREVIITSYEFLVDAIDGHAGTHIVP
ncbi:MAG TPA: carbamate kinase [Candidatus Kapabacteria bacterium]|nr:carbamate kinase [Candidatus Kapabacteria bacterium]